MKKFCISSVVSNNSYQWFIPLFVYSAKKAYQNVDIRVALRGEPDSNLLRILDDIGEVFSVNRYDKIEALPNIKYICNIGRLFLPQILKQYRYLYTTDIDFIVLPNTKSHFQYFYDIAKNTRQPYAAARGVYGKLKARHKNEPGWATKYTRIACGYVFYDTEKWNKKTADAYEKYYNKALNLTKNKVYRELDEVWLSRIINESKMPIPMSRNSFLTGKKFNTSYRCIHLGDFKFENRYKNKSKMARLMPKSTVEKFIELEKDEKWQYLCKKLESYGKVTRYLNELRGYVEKRR